MGVNLTQSANVSLHNSQNNTHSIAFSFVNSFNSILISFFCTVFAISVSGHNIKGHLTWYTMPHLQRNIVRILLIVPIYSSFSFMSFIFVEARPLFESLRDVWEAVVVYSFLSLMLEYCGGENACLSVIMNSPGAINHLWPFNCCLPPIPLNSTFLRVSKQLTIQFVVVKPLMAVFNLLIHVAGLFHTKVYQNLLSLVYNTSYTLALYALVLFYKATNGHPGLKHRKPIRKFLAVKIAIFATYYQTLLLSW